VRKRRRRVVAWAARRVDGVEAWSTAALEHGGARGRSRCARAALGEREGARWRLEAAVGDRGGEQGARRRRLGVQASGGEWWRRGGGSKGRRRRDGIESGGSGVKGEGKQRPAARARDIYDRWARDFP
jgi:hypothetical protein